MGLAELMALDESDPEKLELLELIRESGRVLDSTVSKMLTMIYADGQNSPSPEEHGLIDISQFILSLFPLLAKHFHGLDFSVDSLHLKSTASVGISHQHLLDILTELAINLRRNTQPGKQVDFFTTDEDGAVHLVFPVSRP